jgi:outer membrane receptor protein involved in Fe transport
MKMPLLTAVIVVLTIATAAPLSAQSAPKPPRSDTLPDYVLEGVVVTATRAGVDRHDLPQQVDVLTESDLEAAAGDITDALKSQLGLDVIEYPALLSGVAIRGFRPQFSGTGQRTLLLLDGRPAGATNLATLDLAAAERIEVLKGPASALYGSGAMGGVVNIVTRKSTGPIRLRALGSYGSFGTYRTETAAGGHIAGDLDFDLSLAAAGRTDGYTTGTSRILSGDSATKSLAAGGTVQLPELQVDSAIDFADYATRSASARLGHGIGENWRAHASANVFTADDVQNPGDLIAGFGRTLNDLSRRTGEVGILGDVGRHIVSVRGFASREETDYFNDPLDPTFVSFRSPVTWIGAQVQDVIGFGVHQITAGIDYTVTDADSEVFSAPGVEAAPYVPASNTSSVAGFAQAHLRLLGDRLIATAGGRVDRLTYGVNAGEVFDFTTFAPARVAASEETRAVFNPSAGLVYRPVDGLRLHGSGGRAFVAPDPFFVAGYSEAPLTDRRAVLITQGNPDIDPESSTSWDAGIGVVRPAIGIEADLTYFHTDIRDRIVQRPTGLNGIRLTQQGDTILGINSYVNAERAEIRGIEGSVSYDMGAAAGYPYSLRFFARGTDILRAEETSGGASTRIRNVADLTVVSGIEYDDLDRFSARLSGRYVGERLDTDFTNFTNPGDVTYPAFLVLDGAVHLRFGNNYRAGIIIDNIADENYYEVRGYNLPGRSISLQVGAFMD